MFRPLTGVRVGVAGDIVISRRNRSRFGVEVDFGVEGQACFSSEERTMVAVAEGSEFSSDTAVGMVGAAIEVIADVVGMLPVTMLVSVNMTVM